MENWPNICEDVRRLLSTAGTWRGITEAQREAEGFWLSPDLLLGGANEGKRGGSERSSTRGLFFLGLRATYEQGGAEGNREQRNTSLPRTPASHSDLPWLVPSSISAEKKCVCVCWSGEGMGSALFILHSPAQQKANRILWGRLSCSHGRICSLCATRQ